MQNSIEVINLSKSYKSKQAVNQQDHDAEKQHGANAEQNLKQIVVGGCVAAGAQRQHIDVIANPKPCQHKGCGGREHSQGGANWHGAV